MYVGWSVEDCLLNLQNNNHGIGIHTRTLNCMAAGGFLFTHDSERDFKPGGMRTVFEPHTHYGIFKVADIQEQAQYWISNDSKRMSVIKEAQKMVISECRWVNSLKTRTEHFL